MKKQAPITSWSPVDARSMDGPTRPLSPLDTERIKRVIGRLEREREATESSRRRAHIDWAIGQLYEDHLGRDTQALSWLQRAHQGNPSHIPTLIASRRIFARAGQWGMVQRLFNQEIDARSDPEHIAGLYCQKAGVYLTRFKRAAEARACYKGALEAQPDNETAARCLAQVRRRPPAEEPEALAEAWTAAAERCADPVLSEACYIEAAEAARRAGDIQAAIGLLERPPLSPNIAQSLAPMYLEVEAHSEAMEMALSLDPTRPQTRQLTEKLAERLIILDPARAAVLLRRSATPTCLRARLRALRSLESWEEVAATAAALVEETRDPRARALALWELARVEAEQLEDEAAAIQTLDRLLEIDPSWPMISRWVIRLYEAHPKLRRLLHERRLTVSAAVEEQIGHLLMIAEARREEGDLKGTTEAYEAAVALDPDHEHAHACLIEHLTLTQDWEGLLDALTQDLEISSNNIARVNHALLRAQALSTEMPRRALGAWTSLLKLEPNDVVASEMARGFARKLGEWSTLISLDEQGLMRKPRPARRLALLMSKADALRRLGHVSAAGETYLELLKIWPLFIPARLKLRALCAARDDWAPLARAYRYALRADGARLRELSYALGALSLEILDDVEGARFAFERAISADPNHIPSLMGMREIARRRGDTSGEVDLIKALVKQTKEPSLQSMLFHELGLLHEAMGERAEAHQAWLEGVERNPNCWSSRRALIEAAARSEEGAAWLAEWEPLADERVAMWLDVMRWTDDRALALKALEQLLVVDPNHVNGLLHAERLALMEGNAEVLYEIYERLAQRATGKESRWRLLLQKARLFGQRGDFERVYELRSDHAEIVAQMGRMTYEDLDGDHLEQLHPKRLARAETPEERAMCQIERAQLMRWVGLEEEAAESYRAIFDDDPDDYVALEALRELLESQEDAAGVKAIAARLARVSLAPENASAYFMEAGLLTEPDDNAAALKAFMEALQRSPSDPKPLASIRRLAQRLGDWASWAEALALEALPTPEARAARALEIADLQTGRLNDPQGALQTLREAQGLSPEHEPRRLQRLGDLCTEVGDWEGAIEAYQDLRRLTQDPGMSRALSFRLATIYADKLNDYNQARALLVEVHEQDPRDAHAVERLADLATLAGEHGEAVARLEDLLSRAPHDPRALELKLARALMNERRFEEGFGLMMRLWMLDQGNEALFDELNEFAARARRPEWLYDLAQHHDVETPTRFLRFMELLWAAGVSRRVVRAYLRHNTLCPRDPRLRAFEALLLSGTPDGLEEARGIYEALLMEDPREIAYVQMLRRLYLRLKAPQRADKMGALLSALRRRTRLAYGPSPELKLFDEEVWIEREPPDPDLALMSQIERAFPQVFQPVAVPMRTPPEALQGVFDALGRCFEQHSKVGLDPAREVGPALPGAGAWICSAGLPRLGEVAGRFLIASGMLAARWHLTALLRWPAPILERRLGALLLASGRPLQGLEAPPEALAEQADRFAKGVDFWAHEDLLVSLFEALPRWDLEALTRRARDQAYRVGLVYAGGLGGALKALEAMGEAPEAQVGLIRFWLSEDYEALKLPLEDLS